MTDMHPPADTSKTAGCPCQDCGQRYRVDLNVPDGVWQRIGMPARAGLLCGVCIMIRIEKMAARSGGYGYLLVDDAELPRNGEAA